MLATLQTATDFTLLWSNHTRANLINLYNIPSPGIANMVCAVDPVLNSVPFNFFALLNANSKKLSVFFFFFHAGYRRLASIIWLSKF